MEQIKRNAPRILVAQLLAFLFSWYAIQNIFIGPIPRVRPEFKEELKNSPETVIATTQKVIMTIASFASFQASKPEPTQTPSNPSSGFGEVESGPTHPVTATPEPGITSAIPPIFQPRPTSEPTQETQQPAPTRTPTRTPPTVAPTQIPAPTEVVNLIQVETDILAEVNKRRAAAGLGALAAQPQLTIAARNQTNYLSSNGICPPNHTGEGGSTYVQRVQRAGFKGVIGGETVLCGGRTALIAVDMWWSSPPHKMILTQASAKYAGVGWVNGYATIDTGQ